MEQPFLPQELTDYVTRPAEVLHQHHLDRIGRGICGVCRGTYKLLKSGKVHSHFRDQVHCAGSHQAPWKRLNESTAYQEER